MALPPCRSLDEGQDHACRRARSGTFLAASCSSFRWPSQPSYTEVMTGVDPAQTRKITLGADAEGVAYEIRGTARRSPSKGQDAQAHVALAAQGLDSGDRRSSRASSSSTSRSSAPPTSSSRSPTSAALEGADRQHDRPDRRRRRRPGPPDAAAGQRCSPTSQRPATAAVLLRPGRERAGHRRGPRHRQPRRLLGPGPEGRQRHDHRRRPARSLWPTGGGRAAAAPARPRPRPRPATTPARGAAATRCSTARSGPSKAQVKVHSDLNVDKTDEQTLTYAKNGVPLKTTDDTETLTGTGSTSGGAAGTASNLPSYARRRRGRRRAPTTTTSSVDNDQRRPTRPSRRPKVAPGTVNRWTSRVLVDKSVAAPSADGRAARRRSRGRRHPVRARRHARRHADRVRQAAPRSPRRASAAADPGRLRRDPEGRRHRPRRAAVPVLPHAPAAPPRARAVRRGAVLAARAGRPAAARRAGGRPTPRPATPGRLRSAGRSACRSSPTTRGASSSRTSSSASPSASPQHLRTWITEDASERASRPAPRSCAA